MKRRRKIVSMTQKIGFLKMTLLHKKAVTFLQRNCWEKQQPFRFLIFFLNSNKNIP